MRRIHLLLPCVLIAACSSAPEKASAPAAAAPAPKLKAAPKPNAGMIQACSLTSKADAESAAGVPMQEPEGDITTCTIQPMKDGGPTFKYEVMWSDGIATMKAFDTGRMPGSKRVDNLGDSAVLQPLMLHVRQGDVYVMFNTSEAEDSQVIKLARKVVTRLEGRY